MPLPLLSLRPISLLTLGFRGFDSSRILNLRGGILKFESSDATRGNVSREIGRTIAVAIAVTIDVRNLLGLLETRLAQNSLNKFDVCLISVKLA